MSVILTRKLNCGFKTYIHRFFWKELPYFKTSSFFFNQNLAKILACFSTYQFGHWFVPAQITTDQVCSTQHKLSLKYSMGQQVPSIQAHTISHEKTVCDPQFVGLQFRTRPELLFFSWGLLMLLPYFSHRASSS